MKQLQPVSKKKTSRPLYKQVSDAVLERVYSGEWPPSHRIPTENELAESMGVSRLTIHRALRKLTDQGVLRRVRRRGTFVAELNAPTELFQLRNIEDDIRIKGGIYHYDVLKLETVRARPGLARSFNVPNNSEVFLSVVMSYASGMPVQLEERYTNPEVVPDFLDVDFSKINPYNYLKQTVPVTRFEHVIEASNVSAAVRDLLHLQNDEPCLFVKCRTWFKSKVISKVSLIHPGGRYQLFGGGHLEKYDGWAQPG